MSDTQPTASTASKPNPAARYLFMLLLGLVIGVIGTVMALRAIDGGKTWQDHYPHATMHLLQAHAAQLGAKVKGNRCSATDSLPHLHALRTLANDLEPAFPGLADDARFADHAAAMRATLDGALASPPLSCEGLGETASKVGESCKACHQDFRT